jgi:hypothetical protein
MVNHYYVDCVDRDFGPFFLKFCSYFPYTAKLCLNGHEYLKRQLAQERITYTALDNGLLGCADPARAQAICDGLGADRIDALLRKWLAILPHPFSAEDRRAGYRYDVSILQAEFSLTQVLDRPVSGRVFFEEVIREHLDMGRPDQVQLLFARRVTKRTPGRFRTRVITEGVTPSLHVDDKSARIKQYHKEGRGLRTETTVNNPRDFRIGKRLTNLPALRAVGFTANRRLLDVQRVSHDCAIGEAVLANVTQPVAVDGQRAAALPFTDPRVQALLAALVLFRLLPRGRLQPRSAGAARPAAGARPRRHDPGPDDLRPAPAAPARAHRAHPAHPPLPPDRGGTAHRPVLHPHPRPAPPPGAQPRPGASPARPRTSDRPVRQLGGRHSPMLYRSPPRGVKRDSIATTLDVQVL